MTESVGRLLVLLLFLGAYALAAPTAAAAAEVHPLVQKGLAHYEQAQFAQALDAFDRAEQAEGLSRQDLLKLLEGRALVRFATGEQQLVMKNLAQLAAVAPDYQFGADVPPEVISAFRRATAQAGPPLQVRVDHERVFGGELLRAKLTGAAAELVREVLLFARRERAARWQRGRGVLRLQGPEQATFEYYAVAVGPGGAPVVQSGSASMPHRLTLGAAAELQPAKATASGDEGWYFLLGVGAGAVVTATVLLILNALGESDYTQPERPELLPP